VRDHTDAPDVPTARCSFCRNRDPRTQKVVVVKSSYPIFGPIFTPKARREIIVACAPGRCLSTPADLPFYALARPVCGFLLTVPVFGLRVRRCTPPDTADQTAGVNITMAAPQWEIGYADFSRTPLKQSSGLAASLMTTAALLVPAASLRRRRNHDHGCDAFGLGC